MAFNELTEASRARQEEWPGAEHADIAFRALEVAEAVKKYLRADRGIHGSTASVNDTADEVGDLVISAVLLVDQLGIDVGEAVRVKFNRTSEKYGLETRL